MRSLLPTMSEFHTRLRLSGWQFVQSYAVVIFIASFSQGNGAGVILLVAFALTLLNLAQTALNARYPHFEGMRCRPDLSAMPPVHRYINYGIEGLNWTICMIGFFSIYQGFDGPSDVIIWLCAGLFFTLVTSFFAERSLRADAPRKRP